MVRHGLVGYGLVRHALRGRRAFSMVECLVVLAVLLIVVGLALPAVLAARESVRRVCCGNQLRQQGLGLTIYAETLGAYPVGWNTLGHGWSAFLLPYVEREDFYSRLVFEEEGAGNWDSGNGNREVISQVMPLFRCPTMPVPEHVSSIGVPKRVPASYRGNSGALATSDDASTVVVPGTRSLEHLDLDGVFYGCSRVRPGDILDGLSHTLLVCESRTDPKFVKDGQAMDFWYIGSAQVDDCRCDGGNWGTEFSEFVGSVYSPLNSLKHSPELDGVLLELAFGSYHNGGAYALRADGSVGFIDDDIDPGAWRALGSRAGGDT
ncbi:MAG: DUF1559 domain-containing protein [Pirellulales bacterium]